MTDAQARRLMTEHDQHGQVGLAALRAGVHRNTASKYLKERKLPSDLHRAREWQTRLNPFEGDWAEITKLLEALPELEAKTVFEVLQSRGQGRYQEGQLRTLQRHIKRWRAESGPPKEVFFPQRHRPGEAMQTDFTWGTDWGITVGGVEFRHLLCHPMLPYSNWEWVTVCRSESMAAIKRGVQSALVRLGRSPEFHQTDNSTAATHRLGASDEGDRGFNEEYLSFVGHYSMTPRRIEVGKKNQNGDAESMHNVFKKRVEQRLLLRGSRDFECVEEYERWLQSVAEEANALRQSKLAEELAVMRLIPTERVREFAVSKTKVRPGSTIRVSGNVYSVPSRLIGEEVNVRVHEDYIEVDYGGSVQLRTERLVGKGQCRIDYRHLIWSLVQKPGAFARYRYREELFPSLVFRRAYDSLVENEHSERKADLEYLRLLHLAASTSEAEVEGAIAGVFSAKARLTADCIKELVAPRQMPVPEIQIPPVDLSSYDALLEGVAS